MTPPRSLPTDRETARHSRNEAARDSEPVLTTKWTMKNDHWVEAQFLLARSKSGLSDRPATTETRS